MIMNDRNTGNLSPTWEDRVGAGFWNSLAVQDTMSKSVLWICVVQHGNDTRHKDRFGDLLGCAVEGEALRGEGNCCFDRP